MWKQLSYENNNGLLETDNISKIKEKKQDVYYIKDLIKCNRNSHK